MLSITLVSRLMLIGKAIDFVRNVWLPVTEVLGFFSITFQKEIHTRNAPNCKNRANSA